MINSKERLIEVEDIIDLIEANPNKFTTYALNYYRKLKDKLTNGKSN
jgi:hypothetical protein